jgi:hypothetical protein
VSERRKQTREALLVLRCPQAHRIATVFETPTGRQVVVGSRGVYVAVSIDEQSDQRARCRCGGQRIVMGHVRSLLAQGTRNARVDQPWPSQP